MLSVCKARGIKLDGRVPQAAADVASFIDKQHPTWHRFDVVNDIVGGDAATLRSVAEAFVASQARAGVAYTEVRYDPVRFARSDYLNVSISEEDAVKAVQEGLAAGAAKYGVAVYQLLCAMRGQSTARCNQTAQLAARLRSTAPGGVVGLDLAGDEANYGNKLYASCMRYAKRELGLRTTVHSGEFEQTTAEEVRIAVEDMEVDRVGHGYAAARDPKVMQLLYDRKVHVEACPMSALRHGAREFRAIASYRAKGLSFGLNTDDPASWIGNTSLQECEDLVRHRLGFTGEDVRKAYAAARAAGFVPQAVHAEPVETGALLVA